MLNLKGIIGIKEVQGEDSLLYVCDLPGVSFDNLSKIADADQSSVDGVWSDVEIRSVRRFRTAFTALLNERYHICVPNISDCIIDENKEMLSVSLWYLCGAELMVERINSDRLNRFTTIDRKRAMDLRDYFYQEFDIELKQAITSINPNKSQCMPENSEAEYITPITYRESTM